ncbi:MAG: hypothetical protein NTV34_15990 [Proteobacteria bacterium]|nr:hypothetical protein [Pseudomonadota bacterium]
MSARSEYFLGLAREMSHYQLFGVLGIVCSFLVFLGVCLIVLLTRASHYAALAKLPLE